jgi:hypothetical protein
MIELSNTFEARVGSDLCDREVGLVEQVSREVDAPRAGDSYWGRTQVLEEQPPQVTGAEAYALGECFNIVHIERTIRDQFKGSRNHR